MKILLCRHQEPGGKPNVNALSISAKGRGDSHTKNSPPQHLKPTGIPGIKRFHLPTSDNVSDDKGVMPRLTDRKPKRCLLGPAWLKLYIGGQKTSPSLPDSKKDDEAVPAQFVPHPPSKGSTALSPKDLPLRTILQTENQTTRPKAAVSLMVSTS